MSQNIIATKRRIKSISATRKITKAMQLVATSKLKRNRDIYDRLAVFTDDVYKMVQNVLAHLEDPESKYLVSNNEVTLHILITSNLGLCGAYNSNIIKFAKKHIKSNDKLIVFGEKGLKAFSDGQAEIVKYFTNDVSNCEFEISMNLSKIILDMFDKQEIGKVNFIYTEFVNSLTFVSKNVQLLPVDLQVFGKKEKDNTVLLFEPDTKKTLDYLLPLYFEAIIYGKFIEAQVSEQASRRIAMENATDNADEIKDKLMIEYNKARQASITQQITEVVAGANAS